MPTDAVIARLTKNSLSTILPTKDDKGIQSGRDFYKYFFTNFPDLRKYFKGSENFTADDVQKSERFEKQGQRILLSMHILTQSFEEEQVFRAYAREMVNKHRQYKMDPSLWLAFFAVWEGYLETKTTLDDETKVAWKALGERFNEECQSHLKHLGLPSAA